MFHHHQSQFLPINIVNSERLALFPWQTIVERCTDKETVVVEVLGNKPTALHVVIGLSQREHRSRYPTRRPAGAQGEVHLGTVRLL